MSTSGSVKIAVSVPMVFVGLITINFVVYTDTMWVHGVFKHLDTIFTDVVPVDDSDSAAMNNPYNHVISQQVINDSYSDVMFHRRQVMKQACQNYTTYPDSQRSYFYSAKGRFLYCAIPKVGSSFMKRVLYVVAQGTTDNPLHMSGMSIHQNMDRLSLGKQSIKSPLHIKEDHVNIMFTRNPYHKVFSAYTDKIYSTSFEDVCLTISRKFGGNRSGDYLAVVNVSFADTLRYAMGQGVDVHFQVTSRHCDVCNMDYDFIGKMENFNDDLEFFLKSINQTKVFEAMGDVDLNHGQKAISDIIKRTFREKKKSFGDCELKFYVLRKIWNLLQIRGYLSDKSVYPLKNNCSISSSKFETLALRALSEIEDRNALRFQRQKYMLQAFRSVPLEVLKQYRDFVQKDCDLFDYDCSPPELFQGRHEGDEEGNIFSDIKYILE